MPIVKTAGAVEKGALRSMVLVPISRRPPVARLIGVPERVTPPRPAIMVVLSSAKTEGLAVKVWPAMVKTGGGGDRKE